MSAALVRPRPVRGRSKRKHVGDVQKRKASLVSQRKPTGSIVNSVTTAEALDVEDVRSQCSEPGRMKTLLIARIGAGSLHANTHAAKNPGQTHRALTFFMQIPTGDVESIPNKDARMRLRCWVTVHRAAA